MIGYSVLSGDLFVFIVLVLRGKESDSFNAKCGLILASISSCLVINFGGGFRSRLTSHPLNKSLSRRKAAEEPCLLNRFNRTEEYRLDDGNWPQ